MHMDVDPFLRNDPICLSINECEGAFKRAMSKRIGYEITPFEKSIILIEEAGKNEFYPTDEDGPSKSSYSDDSSGSNIGYVSFVGYLSNLFYASSAIEDHEGKYDRDS